MITHTYTVFFRIKVMATSALFLIEHQMAGNVNKTLRYDKYILIIEQPLTVWYVLKPVEGCFYSARNEGYNTFQHLLVVCFGFFSLYVIVVSCTEED